MNNEDNNNNHPWIPLRDRNTMMIEDAKMTPREKQRMKLIYLMNHLKYYFCVDVINVPICRNCCRKQRSKKGKTRIHIGRMMIAAKEFVEIAEELEKKASVSIEEVKRLGDKAKHLAKIVGGIFSVQKWKGNKKMEGKMQISKCTFEQVDQWCKKILLDEEVKESIDMMKNIKNEKQRLWSKLKRTLPVFDLNEIISKIEKFDKDIIYAFTDGSCKIDKKNSMNDASGVGIIIIFTETDHQRIITMCGPIFPPPDGHSSQYAERFAIETALEEIYLWEGYVGQKVVIFTDNLEVVKAFKQYKERGTAGDVCSLDFNQMKSRNKYFPIYKLVQLFRVDKDKVPMFNLQFENVYSTHSGEDVNNRASTKPGNPGNEKADKPMADERPAGRRPGSLIKSPMRLSRCRGSTPRGSTPSLDQRKRTRR
ncbi:unnamed protein product, partial [Mesorhabditis belari]|uniref:RNase H type-1 domain-containing protein n=1 Tax=Mesorhabditis belari TaxID=2138241 RepID=A0AAF3E984_9BILA